MKTILLPLNLGAETLPLFEFTEPLAAELEACLVLLHIIPKQPYDNGTFAPETDVHQRQVQESRMILEQLSRQAITHGIRTKVMILDGAPVEVILNTARTLHADLIVLDPSRHGSRGTSARILEAAPCPVLTRRTMPASPALPKAPHLSPLQIVVPASETSTSPVVLHLAQA